MTFNVQSWCFEWNNSYLFRGLAITQSYYFLFPLLLIAFSARSADLVFMRKKRVCQSSLIQLFLLWYQRLYVVNCSIVWLDGEGLWPKNPIKLFSFFRQKVTRDRMISWGNKTQRDTAIKNKMLISNQLRYVQILLLLQLVSVFPTADRWELKSLNSCMLYSCFALFPLKIISSSFTRLWCFSSSNFLFSSWVCHCLAGLS